MVARESAPSSASRRCINSKRLDGRLIIFIAVNSLISPCVDREPVGASHAVRQSHGNVVMMCLYHLWMRNSFP